LALPTNDVDFDDLLLPFAERDGHDADPESIYLTAGASAGVSQILGVALKKNDGCMIPIPQYPLYTATLAYVSAKPLPYYLSESSGWSLNHDILLSTIASAKSSNTPVKALAIINPGNPTGACLSYEAIQQVIQLCYDEGILLLADEVYQANIFDEENKPFVSFKKVLREMKKEVAEGVELVSFHSISKGVSGECGRRGGYFEVVNVREDVMAEIYKMASIALCPPVTGQVSSSPGPKFKPLSL
jgi:alanine transaminase